MEIALRGGQLEHTPEIYFDFVLCDRFKLTPRQVDEMDDFTASVFYGIILAEQREQKRRDALEKIK